MGQVYLSFVLFLAAVILVSADTNSTAASTQDLKTAGSTQAVTYTQAPSTWPDLWKGGVSQIFSIGGIILSGALIFGGILWLLGLNGGRSLRLCNWFGTCDKQAVTYDAAGNLQDPNALSNGYNNQQYYPSFYNSGYLQKRSINLLGPMFQKLGSVLEIMQKNEEPRSLDPVKKQE